MSRAGSLNSRINRQQFGAWPEESFDAPFITNTNLNVTLGVEACSVVQRLSFDSFTNALVTTVKSDDESRKASVHRDGSAVASGEFALLRDNSSFDEELHRFALGLLF